jgi:threonine synthase
MSLFAGLPELVGRDGARYPLDEPGRWRGDDGSPLSVTPLPGITRADIDTGVRSQWRYAAALPLPVAPVTLGEGCTPLLETRAGVELLLKPEWFNPTASFKDRGVSVMVSWLRHLGIDAILEDSSGNGGASVAAYGAAAGMAVTILAPESTSPAKLLQSRMHGASVELVPGARQATADAAVERSALVAYASHSWHPMFLQGVKLLAYEIWEDLGFQAPDVVLVPAGGGSLVLGCRLGFAELKRSGAIDRMPRLLAVQPENVGPLAAAFAADADEVEPREWLPTIAEGTAIARPVRDREVLAAVRASGGAIVSVSEQTIADAVLDLASIGLFVEPSSAQVAAALPLLIERGHIRPGDRVVAVLTASGLKSPDAMAALL